MNKNQHSIFENNIGYPTTVRAINKENQTCDFFFILFLTAGEPGLSRNEEIRLRMFENRELRWGLRINTDTKEFLKKF